MSSKYCSNCGAKHSEHARFCPKCGQEIGGGKSKPAARKGLGFIFFALSIVFSFIGLFILSSNPKTGGSAASMFFVLAGFMYLAAVFMFFRWLFRKNRKIGIVVVGAIIIASSFTVVYYQTQRAYLSDITEIMDIGAEAIYAKSVGDDLVAGRKISDSSVWLGENSLFVVNAQENISSMAQVRSKLEREYSRLKAKKVRSEIEAFRLSVETWTQTVFEGSNFKNPESPTGEEKAKWQKLPTTPAVVAINLRGEQQSSALDSVAFGIKQLQSTGDLAIASEDRSAMRLVAAKAQIASNFVESLTLSSPNICSKRGCAPEVKTFATGVFRTAHNYAVGNSGAAQDWDNTWSKPPEIISGAGQPLGGLGISQGSPDPTPPPNKPTTLRSVSPDYKPKKGAPPWDGQYTTSTNVSCDAGSSDYADSIADSVVGGFEVRGGKIIGPGGEIAIDDSGYANYSLSIEGINANVDYYFVQTDGGVSLSGNFSLYGGAEDFSMSCSGDFSGYRISL